MLGTMVERDGVRMLTVTAQSCVPWHRSYLLELGFRPVGGVTLMTRSTVGASIA